MQLYNLDDFIECQGVEYDDVVYSVQEFGLKVQERAFTVKEVYEADEVFISAATLPILAVVKVEDKLINNGIVGEFSKKLRERYIKGMKEEASINKTL